MRTYWVYILTNTAGCYYVGSTGDLQRRWCEHLRHIGAGHTREFHITRLVYAQAFPDRESARRHERSLKRRSRDRKRKIIWKRNPEGLDLSVEWGWRKGLDSRIMR